MLKSFQPWIQAAWLFFCLPCQGTLLSAAIDWGLISPEHDQSIILLDTLANHYQANHDYQPYYAFSLATAYPWHLPQHARFSLGLEYQLSLSVPRRGQVQQLANPNTNTLSYAYRLRHHHLSLVAAYQRRFANQLTPYLETLLGVSRNDTRAYQESANSNDAVATSPFTNQKRVSWMAGIGSGFLFSHKQQRFGIGYRCQYLGLVSLGPNALQTNHQHWQQWRQLSHTLHLSLLV